MLNASVLAASASTMLGAFALSAAEGHAPRMQLDGGAPRPQKPAHQGLEHYRIHAKLNEKTHQLTGTFTLTFTNPSARDLHEVYFHLYLNAFQKGSLFLRDRGGRSGVKGGAPGSLVLSRLVSPRFPGVNLWENRDEHSPDDPKDQTDIRVPLPSAIRAGETIALEGEFTAQLPEIVERTGYFRDYHLVAQWYPKLAKLEPDGTWAHFAFHPFAEFYSNFGNYDVELDLPSDFTFGGTGVTSKAPQASGRTVYHAQADAVVDFAWTASPNLKETSFDVGDVKVHLLSTPSARRSIARHKETLEIGLPALADAYGPYPYPTLTAVRPPRGASRSGGMEYPSFITTGGSEVAAFLGVRDTELVTIHELAHQWFQGLVATNETLYPFLDEGLTSYAELRFLEDTYGPGSIVDLPFFQVSRLASLRPQTFLYSHPRQPLNQPAKAFDSFGSLGALIYGKTALSLETLARVYGRDKLRLALRSYVDRFRHEHPVPDDLYQELARHLGIAESLLHQMFDVPSHLDVAIDQVRSSGNGPYQSQVLLRRRGDLALPYEVQVTFKGGASRQFQVPGEDKTHTLSFAHADPVLLVQADPEHKLLLDENLLNNRYAAPNRPPRVQAAARLSSFFGALLFGLGP